MQVDCLKGLSPDTGTHIFYDKKQPVTLYVSDHRNTLPEPSLMRLTQPSYKSDVIAIMILCLDPLRLIIIAVLTISWTLPLPYDS